MSGRHSTPSPAEPAAEDREHLDALLDEALDETFPASDPPAILEPAPGPGARGDEERSEEPADRE